MKRLYEVCARGSTHTTTITQHHTVQRAMFVVYAENNGSIQLHFDSWRELAIEEIAVSPAFYRDGYTFGSLTSCDYPNVLFGRNPVDAGGSDADYVDMKIDKQKESKPKRILELNQ